MATTTTPVVPPSEEETPDETADETTTETTDETPEAAPVTYVPYFQAPGRSVFCRGFGGNSVTKSKFIFESGVHYAIVESFSIPMTIWLIPNTYCVEANVYSTSSPGAHTMTWSAELYYSESSITIDDITAVENLNFSGIRNLFLPQPPDRSTTADRSVSHTCTSPCLGGVKQTTFIEVDRHYLKTPAVHVFGEFAYSVDDWSGTASLQTQWEATTRLGTSFSEHFGGILSELREDLNKDLAGLVMALIRSLWTGGD